MSKTGTDYTHSSIQLFRQYKALAEKAIAQVNEEEIHARPEPESNSIYLIVKHMSGNMKSRWTDFLTADGEKEWRNRDSEFEDDMQASKEQMLKLWNEGWDCVFNAMEQLTATDLGKIVTIRSEPYSVMEAINRQVAHYSYHIGQIVFLCKWLRSEQWQTLSIAKGKSADFNDKMMK